MDIPIPEEFFVFPRSVGLELSSRCPLACIMCPQPGLRRARRNIEPNLAMRVIAEVAQHAGVMLEPQGMGEMFVHPEWRSILRVAVVDLHVPVAVLTHGSFLTPEVVDELLDIAPEHVVVGIEGTTREVHEAVARGSDFARVEEGARALLRGKQVRGRIEPHIHVRLTPNRINWNERESFVARWRPLLGDGDSVEINPVCNSWAGKVPELSPHPAPLPTPRLPCPQLWTHANVLEDGRVTPCCLDSEGEIEIGNVRDARLEDIWRGPALARHRRAHLEGRYGEVPLCGGCRDWPNYVRAWLGDVWSRDRGASRGSDPALPPHGSDSA